MVCPPLLRDGFLQIQVQLIQMVYTVCSNHKAVPDSPSLECEAMTPHIRILSTATNTVSDIPSGIFGDAYLGASGCSRQFAGCPPVTDGDPALFLRGLFSIQARMHSREPRINSARESILRHHTAIQVI